MKDQARKLRETGLSYRKIGVRLDVSDMTIRRWLDDKVNERYRLDSLQRRKDPEFKAREKKRRQGILSTQNPKLVQPDELRCKRKEANKRRELREQHQEVTYFIACLLLNKVKIGKTKNLLQRLRTFQCGNPEDLVLLGVCNYNEAELHVRFAEEHVVREWFYLSDRVNHFIQQECRSKP